MQAVDTTFIESWARKSLRLKDPAALTAVRDAYTCWHQSREHRVTVDENTDLDRVNLVLRICLGVERPRAIFASVNTTIARTIVREQALHTPELAAMSDIDLASLIQQEGFGAAQMYHGRWCHDISFHWLLNIAHRAADCGREELVKSLEQIP